jgi:hypothetical protein
MPAKNLQEEDFARETAQNVAMGPIIVNIMELDLDGSGGTCENYQMSFIIIYCHVY